MPDGTRPMDADSVRRAEGAAAGSSEPNAAFRAASSCSGSGDGGGHHHHHVKDADSQRLKLALGIIAGFAVIELFGGVISGSLALLADAGHMVTDASALALALVARHVATRAPTARFSFGQRRAQVLAAFVNGLALFVLIGFLLFESFDRMASPSAINTGLMATVAVIGLIANLAAFRVLHAGERMDVNMRGALLHVIGDILGSVAAIISAVAIAAFGWLIVDPLVTLLVCGLIARSAYGLVKETGLVLLEASPPGADPDMIGHRVGASVEGIAEVARVRAWMLTPDEPQVLLHVRLEEGVDRDQTLGAIKALLKSEFRVTDSTVELEQVDLTADRFDGDDRGTGCDAGPQTRPQAQGATTDNFGASGLSASV